MKHLEAKLDFIERELAEYIRIVRNGKIDNFCKKDSFKKIPWNERLSICQELKELDSFTLKKMSINPLKLTIFWGLAGLIFGVFLSLFIGIITKLQE